MKKLIAILIACFVVSTILTAQEFTESSVLAEGIWHKVKLTEKGIYRIDYDELAALGLDSGEEAAIYSNNFGLLSYYNDDPRPDDLVKTAVMVERGQDGVFNEGDYILFYGNSTHRWKYDYTGEEYNFQRHNYSDTAVYFIKLNEAPLEISPEANTGTHNVTSSCSDYLYIHEVEKQNILRSGRSWYEPVPAGSDLGIHPGFENCTFENGTDLNYELRVLGRSAEQTVMRLNNDGGHILSINIPSVNIYNTAGTYARLIEERGVISLAGGNPDLSVSFHNNGDMSARAWLDYLILQGRIENSFKRTAGKHFIIRDKHTVQQGNITRFTLLSDNDNLLIWNISEVNNVQSVNSNYSMGEYSFISASDSLKEFMIFHPADAMTPLIEKNAVANQNLHQQGSYDMIIITHPLFYKYAAELAGIHRDNDSYISKLVTPEEIYNEFSGGIPDISALRNYARMVYSRNNNSERKLKYLLLFGDGSFENKTLPPANPNFIPTYQTENSHISILSFTSDDYYGLLDAGEGGHEGYLDLGIGRLPVSDTAQAAAMINKIRNYIDHDNTGPWRNIIAMVADDEDNNIHMNDSDNLADLISNKEPAFNIDKIYLDSYKQVTTVNGDSYPDATKAINNRVNNGCLIINYAGHGSENGLAHERVVSIENINSWSNKGKYPVFITATCEFSRFENVDIDQGTGEINQKSSAGELALLNPGGGAIALMTTTRIVFASHNYNLAVHLYENAFSKDEDGRGLTMGEIMRQAKINTEGANKRNFTLLGDPALRLAYPWHGRVVTDSINGVSINEVSDTIKALSDITVSGHISDNSGRLIDSFNGLVYTALYDKEYEMTTLANDGGLPFDYMAQDRVLFRGKAEVINGRFRISMLIPRDIDYTFGKGKLSYFAADGSADYTGFYTDLVIGGFSNTTISDTTGPLIKLYLNDTLFRDGGITGPDPILLAHLSDSGSINTTGTGIGHDIVAVIDEDKNNSIVLNNYYENDLGTYQSGKIYYPLKDLSKGTHSVTLKAWDNYNNSSSSSLMFFVRDEDGLVLNRLINYPNPFVNSTKFSLEHNRPDATVEIIINIYSQSGRLIKTIKTTEKTGGYSLKPISWDARDNNGSRVAAGSYIYTVLFKTDKNEAARISGRMIIL
ncbi:MAG: type IX secretion system sortase PorU [Bacteroidales bacterium]|nr:type IX secretion system sortase PorU [Bacteroidales bacterium]